jgi:hypothetical protein
MVLAGRERVKKRSLSSFMNGVERSRSAHISGIRIPNASKELYSKLSFVVYQMMLLKNPMSIPLFGVNICLIGLILGEFDTDYRHELDDLSFVYQGGEI